MRQRFSLLAILVAWGCDCSDPFAVPDGAMFACTTDKDCPPAQVCQRQTNTCVAVAGPGEVMLTGARLTYLPSPGTNPLVAVTAARADTGVQIDLTFTQPVQCLRLTASPAVLTFAGVLTEGTACRFDRVVPTEPVVAGDWVLALSVDVRDSLGVVRAFAVSPVPGPLRLDTEPPAAVDVERDGAVQYLRAPFGALATGGAAINQVVGQPGSVQPLALIRALDRSTPIATELARGSVTDAGAFGPLSFPPDPEQVWLVSVDEAGNESPEVLVRQVTWVATHDGRRVNEFSSNPHRVMVRQASSDSRVQPLEVEATGASGIGRPGGGRLRAAGGVGTWQRRGQEFRGSFAPRAVYDTRRARLLAVDPGVSSGGTYAWDGADWLRIADGPGILGVAGAAYDPLRDRVVVFGSSVMQDPATWEFDGASWVRVETFNSPRARDTTYLAFDPQLREVVLVGGASRVYLCDICGTFDFGSDDAWRFDGKQWTVINPLGFGSSHYGIRGVYDPVRREHVLYGGAPTQALVGADSGLPGDSSTATLTWAQDAGLRVRATAGPSTRLDHCLVWDDLNARVLLLGGHFGLAPIPEVWEWTGAAWVERRAPDGGAFPVDTVNAACGYDLARDEVVIGGGTADSSNRTDVFRGGALHRRVAPSTVAPERGIARWENDRVILAPPDGGTFAWTQSGWSRLKDAGSLAIDRLAFDTAAGRLYGLAGGTSVGLFKLEGEQWAGVPSPTLPGPATAFFFDPDAGELVVETPSSTWALRAGAWVRLATDAGLGGPGSTAPTAYGPVHQAVIGMDRSHGFYQWGANRWRQIISPTFLTVEARELVTDTVDGRLLAVQSLATSPSLAVDVVGLNSLSRLRVLGSEPSLRKGAAASYDPQTRRLWVHDGTTHELRLAELRPAVLSHFQLPALAEVTVTSVAIDARAGGSGGARVRLWSHSRWEDPSASPGATNQSPPDDVAPVSLKVTDPRQLNTLLSSERELTVAIEPVRENGTDAGVISVDYIEAVLQYRLMP